MRIIKLVSSILFSFSVLVSSAQSNPLATVKIGDKKYNLHLVQTGETIYQLSKRYQVGVTDILYSNPWGSDTVLLAGQVIKVPVKPLIPVYKSETVPIVSPVSEEVKPKVAEPVLPPVIVSPPPVTLTASTPSLNTAAFIVVEKGMTLYGISKQYNLSMAQLMGWNKLDSLKIKIGDTLLIRSPSLSKMENQPKTKTTDKPANDANNDKPLTDKPLSVTMQQGIDETSASVEAAAALKDKFIESKSGNTNQVTQRGSAGTLQSSNAYMKSANYCLHRTAPTGTIFKVQSLVTNRISYVKVLGKLPETPENLPFMIRVSDAVAKELGISTEKTFVEVSYYE